MSLNYLDLQSQKLCKILLVNWKAKQGKRTVLRRQNFFIGSEKNHLGHENYMGSGAFGLD